MVPGGSTPAPGVSLSAQLTSSGHKKGAMKVLVVDRTTESQAYIAEKMQDFSQSDVEILDLRVKLATDKDYSDRIVGADVLILGSELGDDAPTIARTVRTHNPSIQIILFVSEDRYSGNTLRAAHLFGARKVFPNNVASLDLLQELIAIHTRFREEGRTREGRIIAVAHIKGGVGATSITAALGELCSLQGLKTLLWDLDIESRDLSRGLMANGPQSKVLSSWVDGSKELTRETYQEALFPVSNHASVLMPPDKLGAANQFVCSTEGIALVQRIIDLSRVTHDVVLIDTAGHLGPGVGAIFRAADTVIVVIDDSALGVSAVDYFLTSAKTLLGDNSRILFLSSTGNAGLSNLAADLSKAHNLDRSAWRLPSIPVDLEAGKWPGQGRTLYSLGQPQMKKALEEIGSELGFISGEASGPGDGLFGAPAESGALKGAAATSDSGSKGLRERVLGRFF